MTSTAKEYLTQMTEELDKYSNTSRSELFTQCVSDKLKISLRNYQDNIDWNVHLLELVNPFSVMKEWRKKMKNLDKEIILKNTIQGDK